MLYREAGCFSAEASWWRERALSGGVLLEHGKGHDFEGSFVGRGECDRGGDASFKALQPTCGADAPPVACLQAGEIVFWHRRGQVIAGDSAVGEEFFRYFDANRVAALILGAGIAVTVAEKAGQGCGGARFERTAKDIA